MSTKQGSIWLRLFTIGFLFLSLTIAVSGNLSNLWRSWLEQKRISVPSSQGKTHNNKISKPTVASPDDPDFTVVEGINLQQLMVPATIGGRRFWCVVDTGSTALFWPAYFNIKGKHTGKTVMTYHVNTSNRSEAVIVSEIRVGKEVWKDWTTFAEEGKPQGPIPSPDAISIYGGKFHIPELGSGLFSNKIITIDLAAQELIIRDPQVDVIDSMRRTEDQLLTLEPDTSKEHDCCPLIRCTIAGRSVRMLFDSGMSIQGVRLAKWFEDTIPKLREKSLLLPNGERFTSHLDWAYGNMQTSSAAVTNLVDQGGWEQTANVAGYVGFELLRKYRVTIDYTRHKMLLQPFSKEQLRKIPLGPPMDKLYGARAIRNKKRWLAQMGY